jgi:ABC-type bacteriocin/lantibiotic exporter with double-glycine peptidase domain
LSKRPLANVDWRKYISLNNTTLNEYLQSYGDDFLNQTLSLVSEAHKGNLPSIILIEFYDYNIVAVVEKKDYLLVLQRLLNLCERLEKYEICAEIVKYQKSIERKSKSPTKKSHSTLTINN